MFCSCQYITWMRALKLDTENDFGLFWANANMHKYKYTYLPKLIRKTNTHHFLPYAVEIYALMILLFQILTNMPSDIWLLRYWSLGDTMVYIQLSRKGNKGLENYALVIFIAVGHYLLLHFRTYMSYVQVPDWLFSTVSIFPNTLPYIQLHLMGSHQLVKSCNVFETTKYEKRCAYNGYNAYLIFTS